VRHQMQYTGVKAAHGVAKCRTSANVVNQQTLSY